MTRRGTRLRAIASRWLDAGTMERVVDPAIADLQREPLSLVGYLAVLKVLAACGAGALYDIQRVPADERRVFLTTIGISFLTLVVLTALLAVPSYFRSSGEAVGHLGVTAAMALLPQVLAVSVPMALMLGIAVGVGGRVPSRRLRVSLAVLAILCSIGSFVNLGWLSPAANQVLRAEMLRAAAPGQPAPEREDDNDLTLGELDRATTQSGLGALRAGGYEWTSVARRRLAYHTRWSLSFATFALVAPLLALTVRRRRSRLVLGLTVVAGWFGYYALLYFSRRFALDGELPVAIGASLPNLVLGVIAVVLLTFSARRRPDRRAPAAS